MKIPVFEKTFLSPFVAVAFAVISITGIMLFFHWRSGPVMALHEWFGWLFVVAGTVHTALNLRPLLAYLRRPVAWISLGTAAALVGLLALGGAQHERGHHGRGHGPAPEARSSSAMP